MVKGLVNNRDLWDGGIEYCFDIRKPMNRLQIKYQKNYPVGVGTKQRDYLSKLIKFADEGVVYTYSSGLNNKFYPDFGPKDGVVRGLFFFRICKFEHDSKTGVTTATMMK